MAPTSQKASVCPIAFILNKQDGTSVNVTLNIRPEDLSKNDVALMTPTQTFAGAWIDDFGPGIATIQISGHTGWGQGNAPDGAEAFQTLYDTIWTQFHADRVLAVQAGKTPDATQLIFSDSLNQFVGTVYPGSFTLRRSKSRPLLFMYQIGLTVLSETLTPDQTDPITLTSAGVSTDAITAGIASLQSSIANITSAAAGIGNLVSSNMGAPLSGFMSLATTAMTQALTVVSPVNGVDAAAGGQSLAIAQSLARVGRNVLNAYGAAVTIADTTQNVLSGISSEFENASCVLSNALAPQKQYQDYSDVFGSSACSSTSGGSPPSPLAGTNPFETLITPPSATVAVTSQAQAAINLINSMDPVQNTPTTAVLASALSAINSGVTLGGSSS